MEIFREIQPLKAFLKAKRALGASIGLVPTMGALHKGHLALLEASQNENDLTICSIYVNPAQFNNAEDLTNYPRNPEKDTEVLRQTGCDVLFCPGDSEMYPEKPRVGFHFGHLETVLEGKYRPGHFSGVALVVSKLFNIAEPSRAYFGQKDWQQYVIIQQLAKELKFDLELRMVPTVREEDGLAMSSRNLRLDARQRSGATVLFKALREASKLLIAGETVDKVKSVVKQMTAQQEVRLEYFEVAESQNLVLLDRVESADSPILCIAGYAGGVRLIDNMFLDLSSNLKRTE